MQYKSRDMLQHFVDFVWPNNCRKALHAAAADNNATVVDALHILRCGAGDITCAVKNDRRVSSRENHDAAKPKLLVGRTH